MFPNLVLSGLPPVTRCNTAVTTSGGQGSILVSDGSACHLNYCRRRSSEETVNATKKLQQEGEDFRNTLLQLVGLVNVELVALHSS